MSDNVKPVSFKKDDEDIKKYLIENGYHKTFSYYIKGLIRKDMKEKVPSKVPSSNQNVPSRRNSKFEM